MKLDVKLITKIQKLNTEKWHEITAKVESENFLALVEENHLYNFLLWHEEDKARRNDMGFEYVYHAKRNIDQYNQKRNNLIEAMDKWIVEHYQPAQSGCLFNSETPGMIIDRLSILALKEYHMREQTKRFEVDAGHITECQEKLTIIITQLQQLSENLEILLEEIFNKTRSFRVYFQCKMYNDPKLNPQLYKNIEPNISTKVKTEL